MKPACLSTVASVVMAASLAACGGGESSEPVAPPDPRGGADLLRSVHGRVAKGPLRSAQVSVYAVDGRGERAREMPLAQTHTADDGSWSLTLPADSGALLVESSGGVYSDESDPEPDPALRRTVTLAAGEGFSAVLPAGASTVALTIYSNALLLKARRETVGHEFLAVLENNRALERAAYGFDPLTTLPADPLAPQASASEESRLYALALGGAAQALNGIAIALGDAAPAFPLIAALVDDLSDCMLDGATDGAPLSVNVDGASVPLPPADLAREILRFRNNHYDAYAQTPLLVPDVATCARSGAAPDTIPPSLAGVPTAVTVAALNAQGTPADDPAIQALFAAVIVTDDRAGEVTLSHDAPAVLPLGVTRVTFTARDAADNVARAATAVTVADLTPPTIVAPPDLTVAQTDTATPVALGNPVVNDNVSPVAEVAVTNDAPGGFPPGVTAVAWIARDAAGLSAGATQKVTVLALNADSDGDGLSDAAELAAGTDPGRADSDADGVGDGLELRTGADPTLASTHVLYVSPAGDDDATGERWDAAKQSNAGLGRVPPGESVAQPTFVLYAANDPASASDAWTLALTPPCDHIVLIGSLGPELLMPQTGASGPTTTFALAGGSGVVVEDCANVQMHDVAITGAGAGALRVTRGSVTLERVHLRENRNSTDGGGLAAFDANVELREGVVAGNISEANGGGVHAERTRLAIEHSLVSGNRAALAGGGVHLVGSDGASRVFDTLLTVNGAGEGGSIALAHSERTLLASLTIAYNEARDGSGAGLTFDGAGAGPHLIDSVFAGNRDGAGVADSVAGLDAAMSSFNLLEEAAIGPGDLDVSATGAGIVGGYYLDQAASRGVDSGSRAALDADLHTRYTDASDGARPDAGTLDRGYHYAALYAAADDYAVDPPLDTIIQPEGSVRVTPLRAGATLGAGHRVIASLGEALVELESSADVDPLANGRSAMLGDLGNGAYAFAFGDPRMLGRTTLEVQVDGVTLPRTLVVIVKTCYEPPPDCRQLTLMTASGEAVRGN